MSDTQTDDQNDVLESKILLPYTSSDSENPKSKGFTIDKPLICFCLVNFLLNAAVSIITPFYPPMAKKAGFSVGMISIVFAVQPVGSFFFAFVIGKNMNKWGRKRCMNIGLIFQLISITAFGALEIIQDNYGLLLGLSLGIRFIQGVSRAAYSAVSFAFVPIIWPNSIQQKISIMESLTGLGLMSGPFLGAALYYYVGYQWVFYIMGLLFSLSLVPSLFLIPDDKPSQVQNIAFNGGAAYKSTKVILLALVVTMTSAGTTFINPMFSIHMKTYDMSEENSSLMLGTMTIVYVVFINFIPALCRRFNKKHIMTVGLLLSGLGDLVMAPLQFLPNEWWVMLIALPIIGIANAMCVLPAIPQFIEFITKLFPSPEQKRQVSDISSGLFVGSYSFGILVGPLLGGQIYELFLSDQSITSQQNAFMWAASVMASIQIVLAIAFFFLAEGYSSMFKKRSKIIAPLLDSTLDPGDRSITYGVQHKSASSDYVYSDGNDSQIQSEVKKISDE